MDTDNESEDNKYKSNKARFNTDGINEKPILEENVEKIQIIEDFLEHEMSAMPASNTQKENSIYIAGILAALEKWGNINSEEIDNLYLHYCM